MWGGGVNYQIHNILYNAPKLYNTFSVPITCESIEPFYLDRYNKRYGSDGIHEPLSWEKQEEEIVKFRNSTKHAET